MRIVGQIQKLRVGARECFTWTLFSALPRALGIPRAGEFQLQRAPARVPGATRGMARLPGVLLVTAALLLARNSWAWHFSGVVWYDTNQNGIRDSGEAGVAGVTVHVWNCTNNALVASTTTASDGSFTFTDSIVPLDGDYQVGFTNLPAGYVFTRQIYPPPNNGTVVSTVNPLTGFAPCFNFDQLTNSTLNNAGICLATNTTATALASLAACLGGTAAFSTVASGTGPFTYAWLENGVPLAGQTAADLVIPSVVSTNAGTYTVVVTGFLNSVTNSATLDVNSPTTATPLVSLIRNPGGAALFSATPGGSGPFTFAWFYNGVLLPNQTNATLTVSPVSAANAGAYGVVVSGACNAVTNTAELTLNEPPTVSIISPTNGSTFIALASMSILAQAQDPDGTISKVDFYQGGTNFLGETTAPTPPYFILWTNVPPGSYTLTAIATDNLSATATSAPVNITVVDQPPVVATGAPVFNPQTDMFDQSVRVTNPTYYTYSSVRLLIGNLAPGVQVYNAAGTTNSLPFVQSLASIAPGANVNFLVEFFVPNRVAPNPTFTAQLVAPMNASDAVGPTQPVNRIVPLPNGAILVEFNSLSNRVYCVQYGPDMLNWQTAMPAVTGIGDLIDWIDSGEPKTVSAPATQVRRYYRVILLP
jgi:SdrD B-like domain/Bacterial Ig domain